MSKEKQKVGRKNAFTDDESVTLSIKVPKKQKEYFRQVLLGLRKPFEIKK